MKEGGEDKDTGVTGERGGGGSLAKVLSVPSQKSREVYKAGRYFDPGRQYLTGLLM